MDCEVYRSRASSDRSSYSSLMACLHQFAAYGNPRILPCIEMNVVSMMDVADRGTATLKNVRGRG